MGRGRVMGRGSAESRLRGIGRGRVGAWLRSMGSSGGIIAPTLEFSFVPLGSVMK